MKTRDLLDQPRSLLEDLCRSSAFYAYLGDREGLCRVLRKYLMYIDPKDHSVAVHLINSGFWEIWITQVLACLPSHFRCADVGANAGYYTVVLADLCKEVYAFEPQPDLAAKLRKTVSVNGFGSKVQVVQAAVGAASGYCEIKRPPGDEDNLGGVSVRSSTAGSVPVVTLDEAVEEPLDFIKIDVEGFEPQVWAGMQRHLANRPTILLEFSPLSYSDAKGFLAEIASCYTLREVDHDSNVVPVEPQVVLDREDFSMLWLEA